MGAILYACILDGRGGAQVLDPQTLEKDDESLPHPEAMTWYHVDYMAPNARDVVARLSGASYGTVEALFAENTRPRCDTVAEGMLLNLRGVNFNEGPQEHPLISTRMLATERRLITIRRYYMLAFEDLREGLAQGRGPETMGTLVSFIAERLTARFSDALERLEDRMDTIEDEDDTGDGVHVAPAELTDIRQDIAYLRRFLLPQMTALTRLAAAREPWLSEDNRTEIRQDLDVVTRYVEGLEELRERAMIIQDAARHAAAERSGRTMYLLSLVAGLFLPLGFVTGLLGVNVGGIPGADKPWAFWALVGGLVGVGVLQWVWFRTRKWI